MLLTDDLNHRVLKLQFAVVVITCSQFAFEFTQFGISSMHKQGQAACLYVKSSSYQC